MQIRLQALTGRVLPPSAAVWLRRLEIACLVFAVAALGWVVREQVRASRDQANWAQQLEEQLAGNVGQNAAAVETERAPGAKPLNRPTGVIGRLELPRLRLSVMTREGTDATTLRRAVGHVARTALPGQRGNAAFAGHRDTFFRKLRDVRTGDEILITTPRGRHRYVVRQLSVVEPTDVSVLQPTDRAVLTLVTCYPFNYIGSAPQRFIVRAELADSSRSLDATGAALNPPAQSR